MTEQGPKKEYLANNTSIGSRPHINPKYSNVHINPNFSSDQGGGKVLVNPKFRSSPPSTSTDTQYDVNFSNRPLPPPPRPVKPARLSLQRTNSYSNQQENIYSSIKKQAEFKLDNRKKSQFENSIQQTVNETRNKVLVNPKFLVPSAPPVKPSSLQSSQQDTQECLTISTAGAPEGVTPVVLQATKKDNLPGSSKSSKLNLFTPIRKSAAFKKIGSRKLVRVKRRSSSITPTRSPTVPNASFKKIGSKKLIRIKETHEQKKDQLTTSTEYKVKTNTKIVKSVKNTPSNTSKYRFGFITPLSMRKNKLTSNTKNSNSDKKRLSSFRSRFKLDRRSKSKQEPKVLFKSASQTKLKKMSGSTYRVSSTKLQKVPNPPTKPARVSKYRGKPKVINPSIASSKVITVQGVKFSVADNGRKLKRLSSSNCLAVPDTGYSASVSQTGSPGQISSSPQQDNNKPSPSRSVSSTLPTKVYLGGEEFDEVEPGVFTRSRHSLTRQSITLAKNKSINIILKNQSRSKQYCMFFNKFGKCTKKEKGSCPFLHDPDKVAVCRKFLQGACVKDKCLLSHKVAPEKMPACKFFLEGLCAKENCPYLHVKVNEQADICDSFLKGYCANGADCLMRHVMACPQFDRDGICKLVGKCPFPHVNKQTEKKIPPPKPKRKSLGQTPSDPTKKSRVTARYYHGDNKNDPTKEIVDVESEALEAKRKRLMRKIELAKQGWTGVTVTERNTSHNMLDDSGPYEKLEDESDSGGEDGGGNSISQLGESRPPIGQLGDFISLAGYSSEEEENKVGKEDRLI